MNLQQLTPDQVAMFTLGTIDLNATVVFTWGVMLLLIGAAWIMGRQLSDDQALTPAQNLLEVLVTGIEDQVRLNGSSQPALLAPFVGSLFLFIATCNLLSVVPGFITPTGSFSTAAALALCVFVAVPVYGILARGLRSYLSQYAQPSPLMLPFNLLGELSRTLALAVRLAGNVMSSAKIAAVLLAVTPLLVPVVMDAFGLLTGLIQAYIFAVLAVVYISSAMEAHEEREAAPPGASES